jgi:hypothetical protein
MQGRTRQRVEQRHQQKQDVELQGGVGAAQHEGCESYSSARGQMSYVPSAERGRLCSPTCALVWR